MEQKKSSIGDAKISSTTNRLVSLRNNTTKSEPTARRKFVPKSAPRRSKPTDENTATAKPTEKPKPRSNRPHTGLGRGRGRGGKPRDGGRGGRTGGGRGSRNLPSGRVAFVGAKSAGSVTSSSIKKDKSMSDAVAAAGGGINFNSHDTSTSAEGSTVEPTVWPPVLSSEYQPVTLPFGKPKDIIYPNGDKAIFCDTFGNGLLDNDALIFVQLPTRIPIESSSDATPAAASTGEAFDALKCNGFAGKIQVHQSGRTTLQLGKTHFELNAGIAPSFSQQVLSITSREVSILGSIENQVVITPDFDAILAETTSHT